MGRAKKIYVLRTVVATVTFVAIPWRWGAEGFQGVQPIGRRPPTSARSAGLLPPRWSRRTAAASNDSIETSAASAEPLATASLPQFSPPPAPASPVSKDADEAEYRRGIATVASITLLFASNSPAVHVAFSSVGGGIVPPVLLLNAAVSAVACAGLLFGGLGEFLEESTPLPGSLLRNREPGGDDVVGSDGAKNMSSDTTGNSIEEVEGDMVEDLRRFAKSIGVEPGGVELGIWKTLGTTANLYGLSLTSADHGALLIQLTTLIVPLVQGVMGVPIPKRIWTSIALALVGVFVFIQDQAGGADGVGAATLTGDLLCVLAAAFYATYDLRLFEWGRRVAPRALISSKIATQAAFSAVLLLALGSADAAEFFSEASLDTLTKVGFVALWCGLAVNAVAPFLQVGGQQAIGATRAQTLYASQPLWAAAMSWVFLGEGIGPWGAVGGVAFMSAVFLAATAEAPDPNCEEEVCEV